MPIKKHTTKKLLEIEYTTDDNGVVTHKKCNSCKESLALEKFSNNSTCFLQKHNWCKTCAAVRVSKQRAGEINTPKAPFVRTNEAGAAERRCTKCGYIKPLKTAFGIAPAGFMGHDSECTECKRRRAELKRRQKGIGQPYKVPILKNEKGVVTHRACSRCCLLLPLMQFHKHAGGAYLGVHPYCKSCASERSLIAKYGITLQQKKDMHIAQNESCLICIEPMRFEDAKVDHCHKSGVVRGILCDLCNTALGSLKENPESMRRMIEYVLKHNGDKK